MPLLDLSKDYYKILGVSPDADDSSLKKAYYALAKKFHPDKNDAANAEERFKAIQGAYDFLSSAENRAAYDRDRERKKAEAQKAATATQRQTNEAQNSSSKTNNAQPKANCDKKENESGAKTGSQFRFDSAKSYARTSFDFRKSGNAENKGKAKTKTSNGKDNSSSEKDSQQKSKNSTTQQGQSSKFGGTSRSREKFAPRFGGRTSMIYEDIFDDIFNDRGMFNSAFNLFVSHPKLPSWEKDDDSDEDGIDLRFSPPRKPNKKTSQRRASQVYGGGKLLNDPELDQDLFNWSKSGRSRTGFSHDSDGSLDGNDEDDDLFACRYCSQRFFLKDLNSHELQCRDQSGNSWRRKQDTFKRLVREDKLRHQRNKSAPDKIPQHVTVQCQWCGLRISPTDVSTHVPQCKLLHGNLPRFGSSAGKRENVRPTSSWSRGSCSGEDEDIFKGETSFRFKTSPRQGTSPPKSNTGLFASTSPRTSTPRSGKPKINLSFNVNSRKTNAERGCSTCKSKVGCSCGKSRETKSK